MHSQLMNIPTCLRDSYDDQAGEDTVLSTLAAVDLKKLYGGKTVRNKKPHFIFFSVSSIP